MKASTGIPGLHLARWRPIELTLKSDGSLKPAPRREGGIHSLSVAEVQKIRSKPLFVTLPSGAKTFAYPTANSVIEASPINDNGAFLPDACLDSVPRLVVRAIYPKSPTFYFSNQIFCN